MLLMLEVKAKVKVRGGSITPSIDNDQSMKNQAQMLKPYDDGR